MLNINWFKFELWNKILQRGREAERDTNDAKAMQMQREERIDGKRGGGVR